MKKWVAFFSMTGSLIFRISQFLNIEPDLIFTNNQTILSSDNPITKYRDKIIIIPKNPNTLDYIKIIKEIANLLNNTLNVFITLHGYLRIIPNFFCNTFPNFYNLHPGLINLYPLLKGKDPQIRAFNCSYYQYAGSVIHKVTELLDSGAILLFRYFIVLNRDKFLTFNRVVQLNSFYLWILFFNKYLIEGDYK